MTVYVLKRIGHGFAVLAALLTVVFLIGHSIGDPATLMAGPDASLAQIEAIREAYGLNDPLPEQFINSVRGWLVGDFGNSLWQSRPALTLALERMPATLYLSGVTLLIAVPVSLVFGTLGAMRPRSVLDRMLTIFSMMGVSLPNFWLALMLILVVAVELRWLPTSGFGGWRHVLLPALTLALLSIGQLCQMTRNAVLDELGKQYIVTARAKGVAEGAYVIRHALRNAGIPILTLAGNEVTLLINGAVIVETVFGWPGVGQLLIQAIERRDLPLVTAIVFVVAAMTLVINLIIDIAYLRLDPRIRLDGRQQSEG